MSEDIAQDKKVVKKAFAMHDKQSHEGDKTNLSKLKKGGRTKKSQGTVKKFAKENSIKMKKDAADIDEIKAIKQTTPLTAMAPSAPVEQPAAPLPMMKKGKSVKKYNEGGRALYDEALQTRSKTGRAGVEAAKESTLGKPSTPEQKEMAKKESIKLGTLDFPYSKKTAREFSEMKKGGKTC